MKRRMLALGLALLTVCSLGAAAFAAEEPIAPIPEEAETIGPAAEAPAETLVTADEPVTAAAALPTEEVVQERLMAMQEKWPDGTYWGYDSYYVDKSGYKEYACFGFAIMLQEAAFPGLYGPYQKSGPVRIEDVWVGDMLSTPGHTSIVIAVNEDEGYLVLADGNWSESVRWGNIVSADNMGQFVTRWTYYTQKPSRHKNGWYEENGAWHYYEKDVLVHNAWRSDGEHWSFLGGDGNMVTGLYYVQTGRDDDGWYYFEPRHNGNYGYMLTGWQQVGDEWYYFDDDSGAMVVNQWIADGDVWNYLDGDGRMVAGLYWVYDGAYDGLYYFEPRHNGNYGKMLTGWQTVNGSQYYFEEKHTGDFGKGYANGTYTIDGVECTFDSQGRLLYYFE